MGDFFLKPAFVFHGDGSGDAPFKNSFSMEHLCEVLAKAISSGVHIINEIAWLGKKPKLTMMNRYSSPERSVATAVQSRYKCWFKKYLKNALKQFH